MALLLDLLVTGNTRLNDDTYAKNIYADKFIKNGSSDDYVLLGGGGHKKLNDFSVSNHTHSEYLPCLRMRNPSTSNNAPGQGGIPFPISLKGAGYPLYDDPEFAVGTNNVTVYKLSGAVTLTRILDNQKSNNSSGHILQISTSAGAASPGRGGFYQKIPARANAVYAQIFRAKIPVGFSVVNTENPMGTNYSTHWLTDTAGTGKWEWYIRVTICGKEGTFNEPGGGGHVYLNGTGAVTWYLSYCNVIDLTMGNYDGLRTKFSDTASYVTVDDANSNSNYNMVFYAGSGSSLCSSTGIYCNPNTGYINSNGLTLKNTGENCLEVYGGISSYKASGTVLSTVNNENVSVLDTIYNHGNGNLSINAPNGNLFLSRNRGNTYIGGSTYYIDRAGNLGSDTSRWQTIWANTVNTDKVVCNAEAKIDGRVVLATSMTDDNSQYLAGSIVPVIIVGSTGSFNVPQGVANGAMVILVKRTDGTRTYHAGNGIKFCCCWKGGNKSADWFNQTEQSCMMIYYNKVWYVMQFS